MAAKKWRRHHEDRSARAVPTGFEALEARVLYSGAAHSLACACGVCRGTVPEEVANASLSDVRASLNAGTPADLSQTFKLSSLLNARHTIYLDFNGHTTTGTLWNQYENNSQPFTTPAYSTDAAAGFSAAELTTIQHIWQRVAEDFAPFNVNVTTEQPTADEFSRSGAPDTMWGVRVVIGGSSQQWFGVNAGGVAWVGSFNWNSDTPVFVFEEQLGNGHEKYTAEAITHEVGHALGLGHDGMTGGEYYEGHGDGDTGWAPIMGAGYYRNVTQWSRGQYSGASNTQDDLSIITTQNGFGYRADDTGNAFADAYPLSVNGTTVQTSGIIERNTDIDVYTFTTAGGDASFEVNPVERGPNLDVLLQLVDADGNIVAAANPSGRLDASVSATLPAGTYYLRVSGGAESNGWYGNYGSLGHYAITGTVQAAAAPPSLVINNVAFYEGNGWARMTVSLSAASDAPVRVTWGTAANTAKSARDYYARAGQLYFTPGETRKFLWVKLIDDHVAEATERLMVGLVNPTGATIGRAWGSMFVLDNEAGAAARRTAQASRSTAASPATSAPLLARQLQQAQRSHASGFQWSMGSGSEDGDDRADDVLASLTAVA